MMHNTCVLMYHGISRRGEYGTLGVADFEHQLKFLSRLFEFVTINDSQADGRSGKRRILLTFDDGFHNNYKYAIPVLKRLKVPAIFFVNNRHCYQNKFLWFSYLRAMEGYFIDEGIWVRTSYYDFSPRKRAGSFQSLQKDLLNLEPHPSELYKILDQELPPLESYVPDDILTEYFSGMSMEEIKLIAEDELFDIGMHTVDHVLLSKCSRTEILHQITQNIRFISSLTNKNPCAIAYPSGDYNESIIEICRDLNIRFGFALQSISKEGDYLELPRLGIYSPSLLKLLIKVVFYKQIRSLHIPIG